MAIAFVPVRGGSKSIPLKNIKELNGKPLVYWCLSALQHTNEVSEVVVATDSDEIESTVKNLGLDKVTIYRRDPANAQDNSSTEAVMLEYLEKHNLPNEELFILVQATSPLIKSKHISQAIDLLFSTQSDSALSVVRSKRFFWNEDGTPLNYDFTHRPRRQDFNGLLMENGAFYINRISNVLRYKNRLSGKICTYEMPEYTAIEIDEPDDWIVLESLMRKHSHYSQGSAQTIKLVLTDVDGTLTDAGMYYTESGDELKKFSTYDGKAFELLRNAGIKTGIITTEKTKIVKRRAEKIKADYLYQGISGDKKLEAAKEICKKEGIKLENVAYIGDDINCIPLLQKVGIAACPANAVQAVKSIPNLIHLNQSGGNGAVRELVDLILRSQNS